MHVRAPFLFEALTIVSCARSSRLFSEEYREGRARKKFDRDITHAIGSAYSLTHSRLLTYSLTQSHSLARSLTWHGGCRIILHCHVSVYLISTTSPHLVTLLTPHTMSSAPKNGPASREKTVENVAHQLFGYRVLPTRA